LTVEDTGRLGGEEVEETTRKVETSVGTSRTFVRNGGNSGLSVGSDTDLLEAVGTGVSATKLGGVQSDNKVTGDVIYTAGA
jgi:hypothetical protein